MVMLASVKKKTKIAIALALNIGIVTSMGATYSQASEPFTHETARELECVALNIYYETRGVSLADAMAVSDVVLNRVLSTKYPNTMCEVVKQGYKNSDGSMKRNKCQFSWYCDGKSDVPKDITSWERSRKYARDFYVHGAYVGITEGSTHYHGNYTTPYWAPSFDRVTRIGSHIFYRMKGK